MLNTGGSSTRSQSVSSVTESVRTVPTTNLHSQISHQTSITEEDDDRSVVRSPPPAPTLPSSFQKSKSSSRSSQSTSSESESTIKPNVTPLRTNFRRSTPSKGSSTSESSSARRKPNTLNKTPANNSTIQKLVNKNIGQQISGNKNNSSSAFTSQIKTDNSKLSTFEKVDRHSGNTTYLGNGTYSQLENCIRNCLTQNTSHNDSYHSPTTLNSTHKTLTRASILEDYSYEGIAAPREQINISTDKFLQHSHSHYDDHHHHSSHHIKHAAELPIDEIRQVNDALAKYGIPIFSHADQSNSLNNRPRPVGEVLSVCQQLLNDPSLRSQQTSAVQHVWDSIHNHSPQTYMQGYASPAVKGVASHLFGNPYQPPYNPVQSVASHIFNSPPQNSYYPPPPPPFPSYQPSSYPPAPPPPPPPSGPSSAGQSILSRLFSR